MGAEQPRRLVMTAEQGSPTTEAGRWLLDEYARTPGDPKWHPGLGLDSTILAIEREARQQALTDAIAAVEGLTDNEWRECGGACHDHTLAAVIDTLTRLRDGS